MSKADRIREENKFINKPVISKVAETVANQLKTTYSDPRYQAHGKTLSVRWLAVTRFDADARVDDAGNHQISLSYGTAFETYRDGFVLPLICQRTLTDPFYDPLYELLSYGNDRKDVLPAGLTLEKARTDALIVGGGWLYCHEQAHLFQAHGDIAQAIGAGVLGRAGAIAEAEGRELLRGRDAAVRHVFELCADHEATFVALKEMTKFGAPIKQSELWLFVVTLYCMFQRLGGRADQPLPETARGSHPHPAFRMRMAVKQIRAYLNDPLVRAQMGHSLNPAAIDLLLEHAVTTAAVYWHIRYREESSLATFMKHVQDRDPVPAAYRDQIFNTWRSIAPEILGRYMGWGGGRYHLHLASPDDLN